MAQRRAVEVLAEEGQDVANPFRPVQLYVVAKLVATLTDIIEVPRGE